MPKQQVKNVRQVRKEQETASGKFDLDKLIPAKYQPVAAIGVIIILLLIYFAPMFFGGQTFQSGDISASMSHKNYLEQNSKHLWNPYIFFGMPSAMTFGPDRWYDFISKIYLVIRNVYASLFSVPYAGATFYLIILAATTFFLMKSLKASTTVSLFVALATIFSTGLVVFLFIGHVTKLAILAFYPLLFLILLKFQKEIKLIYVLLLIVTLHLLFEPMHVQIIFYTFFAVGIYFLYYFIRSLFIDKDKQLTTNLLKSLVILIVAAGIAVLMSYDKYMQTYEYTKYSTRGTKAITEEQAPQTTGGTSDFYDYATSWSFSPGEVMTMVVPSYYGFGGSTYKGELTNNQPQEVNTYFGQMPFVDVAVGYMGIIIFALGLLAIFINWKNRYVQFLTILIVISLLISFGRTFSPVFDLMFNYFPGFNKFRVPSMILVLVQMSFPVLAGLGIMRIIELKREGGVKFEKLVRNIAFAVTGILFLSLVLNSVLKDGFISRVNDHVEAIRSTSPQYAQMFQALSTYMADMYMGDIYVGLFLLTLSFWLMYLFVKKKLSADLLVIALTVFLIIDLWRIDSRGAKYVENPDSSGFYNKPAYITAIEQQNDKQPYRLLNLKQDGTPGTFGNANQNYNVYFLKEDFSGYSGIKPRTYQDLMDVIGTPVNETLWRMLNLKYVVTDKPVQFPGLKPVFTDPQTTVSVFENALPRAYFVDSVAVKSSMEILNMIKNNAFDPKHVAYMESDPGIIKSINKPDTTASVKITKYENELIDIEANAAGNNLLFLGDTYYPLGWKASIDGKAVSIYRVNHGFMGVVVPNGKHKVEFEYSPSSFYTGKTISLILNSIIVIGLFAAVFMNIKTGKKDAKQ